MATLSSESPQPLVMLVCIVDDSADYRLLVEALFKRHLPDYWLHLFDSGQALLDALPQLIEKPNLIILDQPMPHLNGYQTMVALKRQADYGSLPIVMMSADASHSEIKSFYEAGATSFLTKPVDSYALRDTLVAACDYARK